MKDKTTDKIAKKLISKGIRLVHKGQFENSLIKLNKAIELNPKNIRAYEDFKLADEVKLEKNFVEITF